MSPWVAANFVLAAHIALFVLLGAGLVAAAFGWLRGRPRLALAYWSALGISVGWQLVPGCPLTDIERWLRLQVDPAWAREPPLLRMVIETLFGFKPNALADYLFHSTLATVGAYALVRHHVGPAIARMLARSHAGRRPSPQPQDA
ncbi:MAG: hypothetical protein HY682_07220 [Chloroflexi bacterium]|nr:hypothetical protein [Chloroflexota bacterium]